MKETSQTVNLKAMVNSLEGMKKNTLKVSSYTDQSMDAESTLLPMSDTKAIGQTGDKTAPAKKTTPQAKFMKGNFSMGSATDPVKRY